MFHISDTSIPNPNPGSGACIASYTTVGFFGAPTVWLSFRFIRQTNEIFPTDWDRLGLIGTDWDTIGTAIGTPIGTAIGTPIRTNQDTDYDQSALCNFIGFRSTQTNMAYALARTSSEEEDDMFVQNLPSAPTKPLSSQQPILQAPPMSLTTDEERKCRYKWTSGKVCGRSSGCFKRCDEHRTRDTYYKQRKRAKSRAKQKLVSWDASSVVSHDTRDVLERDHVKAYIKAQSNMAKAKRDFETNMTRFNSNPEMRLQLQVFHTQMVKANTQMDEGLHLLTKDPKLATLMEGGMPQALEEIHTLVEAECEGHKGKDETKNQSIVRRLKMRFKLVKQLQKNLTESYKKLATSEATVKVMTDKLTTSEATVKDLTNKLDNTPDPQSGFSLRSALPSWLGGGDDAPPQKRARE